MARTRGREEMVEREGEKFIAKNYASVPKAIYRYSRIGQCFEMSLKDFFSDEFHLNIPSRITQ